MIKYDYAYNLTTVNLSERKNYTSQALHNLTNTI